MPVLTPYVLKVVVATPGTPVQVHTDPTELAVRAIFRPLMIDEVPANAMSSEAFLGTAGMNKSTKANVIHRQAGQTYNNSLDLHGPVRLADYYVDGDIAGVDYQIAYWK